MEAKHLSMEAPEERATDPQRRKVVDPTEIEQRKRELISSLSKHPTLMKKKETPSARAARKDLFENTRLILRHGSVNAILDKGRDVGRDMGKQGPDKSEEQDYCIII